MSVVHIRRGRARKWSSEALTFMRRESQARTTSHAPACRTGVVSAMVFSHGMCRFSGARHVALGTMGLRGRRRCASLARGGGQSPALRFEYVCNVGLCVFGVD